MPKKGSSKPVDDSKYGKDFKIPELPPLLQQQLYNEESASGAWLSAS
jgi:hypothetical protein